MQEPVNHIEIEAAVSGPVLLPHKIVTVNGTNIYNCKQVEIEHIPGQEFETRQVTIVFDAVANVYSSSSDREPRSVNPESEESQYQTYEQLRAAYLPGKGEPPASLPQTPWNSR